MSAPQGGEEPRVVIRDKRRIDPTTGTTPARDTAVREEQMSEHETQVVDESVPSQPAAESAPAGDLEKQLAERTEDLQRVTAEYANYRRRVDRDRALVVDQAAERFAAQLFPIVDDIERARDHGDLTGAFKVVADRVLGLLEGIGATPYGTNGDPFDPSLHEAVMHDTSPDVDYSMVTTVLRQGYRRGDRVLRTAMVAVTDPAGPAPAGEQGTADDAPASE
jgi:molecular chaperone GrpE